MFLVLDVEVSFSFDSSSTTGFEFNSLHASLLTVLRLVYAIVRLSSGKYIFANQPTEKLEAKQDLTFLSYPELFAPGELSLHTIFHRRCL